MSVFDTIFRGGAISSLLSVRRGVQGYLLIRSRDREREREGPAQNGRPRGSKMIGFLKKLCFVQVK